MKTEEATAINSLIIINNDRYEGYKTAADETKDADLKAMFTSFSTQSKGFGAELKKFVDHDEEPGKDETTNSGKLFRVWMDLKSAVSGNDRKAILSSCEFGEDAAKKTYEDVLKDTSHLPAETLDTIKRQQTEIKQAHDKVKALRDSIS